MQFSLGQKPPNTPTAFRKLGFKICIHDVLKMLLLSFETLHFSNKALTLNRAAINFIHLIEPESDVHNTHTLQFP